MHHAPQCRLSGPASGAFPQVVTRPLTSHAPSRRGRPGLGIVSDTVRMTPSFSMPSAALGALDIVAGPKRVFSLSPPCFEPMDGATGVEATRQPRCGSDAGALLGLSSAEWIQRPDTYQRDAALRVGALRGQSHCLVDVKSRTDTRTAIGRREGSIRLPTASSSPHQVEQAAIREMIALRAQGKA
jgi:hypothetical protein